MKETILTWLNRLLMADVFLVFLGFFWFIAALIGRSVGVPLGLDIWYKLWLPLFNPAIGILFLGAILSWTISKISQKLDSNT